jgi:hypothetical protein
MPSEPIDEQPPTEAPPSVPADRRRILAAVSALAGFGVIVAIVLIVAGGNDSSSASSPAPRECVEAWNNDRDALAFARHNSIFHNYQRAQVGYLVLDGEATVSGDAGGECTVVFARNQLDPEPVAAGQVLRDEVWTPLAEVTDINTVARLQSEAFDGANAEPTPEGEIVPAAPAG